MWRIFFYWGFFQREKMWYLLSNELVFKTEIKKKISQSLWRIILEILANLGRPELVSKLLFKTIIVSEWYSHPPTLTHLGKETGRTWLKKMLQMSRTDSSTHNWTFTFKPVFFHSLISSDNEGVADDKLGICKY
jgi:hypothetical protein